jgi:hypothetical protein
MRAYCTWIISNSWKLMNSTLVYHIQIVLFTSCSQYVPSHTIFNLFAYMHRAVQMGVYRFSFFSMCVQALHGMFPTPQNWMPKTCKSQFETSQKRDFNIWIFFSISNWTWFHFAWVFTQVQAISFWSFHCWTTCVSLKMCLFIQTCSWQLNPLSWIKGWSNLVLSITRLCTFLRCWVSNPISIIFYINYLFLILKNYSRKNVVRNQI